MVVEVHTGHEHTYEEVEKEVTALTETFSRKVKEIVMRRTGQAGAAQGLTAMLVGMVKIAALTLECAAGAVAAVLPRYPTSLFHEKKVLTAAK